MTKTSSTGKKVRVQSRSEADGISLAGLDFATAVRATLLTGKMPPTKKKSRKPKPPQKPAKGG